MAKHLLVIEGDDKGHFSLSVDGSTMTIGGNAKNAPLVLRNLHVACIHCEVEVAEDHVVIKAENRLGALAGQDLQLGQAVHIGPSHVRFVAVEETAAAADVPRGSPPTPGALALAPSAAPVQFAADNATASSSVGLVKKLVVIDGADLGRSFQLPETGVVTIGKSREYADITLHDLYVSRTHCEIVIEDGRFVVRHLEGQSGTLVNGQRVPEQEIRLGDVVRVGNSHLRLDLVADAGPAASVPPPPTPASSPPAPAGQDDAEEEIPETNVEILEEQPEEEAISPPDHQDRLDDLMKLEDQAFGHFQIGSLLARGQASLVFRAQDLKTKHEVALKVLSPDFLGTDAEIQCFVRALKLVAPLKHPHLATLFGAGKTGLTAGSPGNSSMGKT